MRGDLCFIPFRFGHISHLTTTNLVRKPICFPAKEQTGSSRNVTLFCRDFT